MKTQMDPIRTLVVDDSQDECALLEAELYLVHSVKLIGFVHDGVEAIYYLRGVDQFRDRKRYPYPDLLLLDYSMPWCNGMQVLRFIQKQARRPRVVLWSNTLERVSVPLAERLGADLVCRKPTNKRELMEIIHRLEETVFKPESFLPQAGHFETGWDTPDSQRVYTASSHGHGCAASRN